MKHSDKYVSDRYVLDENGNPVAEPDIMKWGKWYEGANRHVGDDRICNSRVSTVFLGIDYSFGDPDQPVLWETMVFGGPLDEEFERCSGSRAQAEAMHARMLERVRNQTTP